MIDLEQAQSDIELALNWVDGSREIAFRSLAALVQEVSELRARVARVPVFDPPLLATAPPELSPGPAGSVIGNLAEAPPGDVPPAPLGGPTGGSGELSPDPGLWFYARDRDDEHWDGACPSREDALAEALGGEGPPDEACYVVLGERPTTAQIAQGLHACWVLDQLIDYASDNGLIGEDTRLEFRDELAFEKAWEALIADHLIRPKYYQCDGSSAERVERKDLVKE